MKKLQSLGKILNKTEQKKIIGGVEDDPGCGTGDTYCGSGSGVTCCAGYTCDDAGNAQNPNVPGGDKLCSR